MNKTSLLRGCLLLTCLPAFAWAQNTQPPRPAPTTTTTTANSNTGGFTEFRPQTGQREFILGGSGGSNRRLSDSFGGATASYGVFFTDQWQGVIRQTINYANPNDGGRTWNGSTKVAADFHIPTGGRLLPFVGVNFGRIYGSSLRDTWAAGIEAGAKLYVQPRTFVFLMAEYNWLFRKTREIDNNFGSGQYYWTTGIGFNF